MEHLKLDLYIMYEENRWIIEGRHMNFWGKFFYFMYYKALEETLLWTNSPRELLAWNIPAFSLN